MAKKILIGNDHGGLDLKLAVVDYLKSQAYEVVDVGSHGKEIVRYPYYAARVASAISSGSAQRGILICSTGIGMSMIANKYKNAKMRAQLSKWFLMMNFPSVIPLEKYNKNIFTRNNKRTKMVI